MKPDRDHPILILGAGINAAAVARELVLNNLPVCVVDTYDIAYGATAKSSRLIHGGLRYLEYGDITLVKESLEERSRLHKLAPHFVKPFRLNIPVQTRMSGFWQTASRFLGLSRTKWYQNLLKNSAHRNRGMWLVRSGLWMYDRLVSDANFPNSEALSVNDMQGLAINADLYRWICSYSDAQMQYPERFTLAMFKDTKKHAQQNQVSFQLFTYSDTQRQGTEFIISSRNAAFSEFNISPSLVINASGAWGDFTLKALNIESKPLFGGTRGSHCLIENDQLRAFLGNEGVYAEADDGRPVFLLPFGKEKLTLIGTTDIPYTHLPDEAITTAEEQEYLLDVVHKLFPNVNVSSEDVLLNYSGVRPLPFQGHQKSASVSRGHSVQLTSIEKLLIATLIGGKLTTCRAFAESVVEKCCQQFGIQPTVNSRNIPFYGGDFSEWEELHTDFNSQLNFCKQQAERFEIAEETVLCLWTLCGTEVMMLLENPHFDFHNLISNTSIPRDYVMYVIEHEWVTCLNDLVERRLMLLFAQRLHRVTLFDLADCLIEAGLMNTSDKDHNVIATCNRLEKFYHRLVIA